MEILQDTLIIYCCHTCGVVMIDLFVGNCLLACVTCMEWLAQLGRFNRLRYAFVLIRLLDLFLDF